MKSQGQYFRSKRDIWLSVVIWIAVFGLLFGAIRSQVMIGAGISMVLVAFVLWVFYGTGYIVDDELLIVKGGPFRWRIQLNEITSVKPTRNPISSPACSLDRLEIRYGNRSLIVSPLDKDGFIAAVSPPVSDSGS